MVNNFKPVSAFSPFLASSKDLTDVYLKTAKMIHLIFSRTYSRTSCVDLMTRKDNDGQVVIRVHVQRGINCIEKTGPDVFCQLRPQGLLKMAADWTSIACVTSDVSSRLLCQSIAIDERFLCGYRLIID